MMNSGQWSVKEKDSEEQTYNWTKLVMILYKIRETLAF